MLLGTISGRGRFGGDPASSADPITLNGERFTVIGVMPSGFRFPEPAGLWIPMRFTPKDLTGQNNHTSGPLAGSHRA